MTEADLKAIEGRRIVSIDTLVHKYSYAAIGVVVRLDDGTVVDIDHRPNSLGIEVRRPKADA